MNSLEQLKSRLNGSIGIHRRNIDEKNRIINDAMADILIIDEIISDLGVSTFDVSPQGDEILQDVLIERNQIDRKGLEIALYFLRLDIPLVEGQKTQALAYLDKVKEKLLGKKNSLELEISKANNSINSSLQEVERFEKFSALISQDNESFVSSVDAETFKDLFDYISLANLDSDNVLDLTMKLSQLCLDNAIANRQIMINRMMAITNLNAENARNVFVEQARHVLVPEEVVEETFEPALEENSIFDPDTLSLEERTLYDEVVNIVNERGIIHESTLNLSLLSLLTADDLSLDKRRTFYSTSNFDLICYDIQNNIIPRLNQENKNDAFEVFAYVKKLYEELNREDLGFHSVIERLSLEEEENLKENRMQLMLPETVEYLRENENLILSYASLINENNSYVKILEELSGGDIQYFDDSFVIFYLMQKLDVAYQEYLDLLKDEKALVDVETDKDAIIKMVQECRKSINNYSRLIEECRQYQESLVEEITEEEKNGSDKNIIIALDYDGLQGDVLIAQEKISGSISDAYRKSIEFLKKKTMVELRSGNDKTIKKPRNKRGKGIKDLNPELKLRRIGFGTSRVAVIWMPVSEKNKKVLKETFASETGNVVLMLGFDVCEDAGHKKRYVTQNSRKAKYSQKIDELVKILEEDFNEESFAKLKGYIEETEKLNAMLCANGGYGYGGDAR